MTFSIVARCAETGMFGVAISSSSPAVAARCSYAQSGVGGVASQNVTDPRLGPKVLALMERGASAAEAVAIVARTAEHAQYRQVLAVDGSGLAAIHSGARALGVFAQAIGPNVACAGNLLANLDVPAAMVGAFAASSGFLPDRLMAALKAGLAAGGEAGPVRSAGLKVVAGVEWPVVDLRCDWSEDCPIADLDRLWQIYGPQLDAYVTRALDPREAPSYGVPGDQ